MNRLTKASLIIVLSFLVSAGFGQSASVSPSRLYYKVAPGGYKSQTIKITNNGKKAETFKVEFADFTSAGNKGKTQISKSDTINNRGCSKWLSASPSFLEVAPGESKDVEILLQLPNTPEASNARWAVAVVKLTKENKGQMAKGSDVVGMQILQTFQFVIHIFQTPPTVVYKEASISAFYRDSLSTDSVKKLVMEVKNTGEMIIDCAPYVELVNLTTGEKVTIKNKGFTVLPGGSRQINFKLPATLKKGDYDVLGVVDYGSDTDIAGAELKLKIK